MYRGGLEFLLGRARDAEPDCGTGPTALRRLEPSCSTACTSPCTCCWGPAPGRKAWYLCRRLRAYAHSVVAENTMHELSLAGCGWTRPLREATLLGAQDVVLSDELFSIYLNVIDLERHGCDPICASGLDGRAPRAHGLSSA